MSWFFIALIPPFLYAVANHTDKYLISKYIEEGKVGALIIFSALFGILVLPVIFYINPTVFEVSLFQGLILVLMGSLVVLSILCYLYALRQEEASVVIPFYQTIPIFGFVLAFVFLGETLTSRQIIASLIILLGTTIISFDIKNKFRFKKKVVILMTAASFMYALSDVLFKLIALERGFWISTFWTITGKVLIGAIFIIFVSSFRKEFLIMIKRAGKKVILINSIDEIITIGADIVSQYAVLLAPVALVLMVNSLQPFFVFVIGVILTLFLPHISQEEMSKPILIQKSLGILIILTGSVILL